MKIEIYDATCCGQNDVTKIPHELENYTGEKIRYRWINLFDKPGALPQSVIKALLDFGKKAIPIICINGTVIIRGRIPLSEEWMQLIKKVEEDEQALQYQPENIENMIKSVTHTLLSPENLDYGMVTAQCCSTTYFCACSST